MRKLVLTKISTLKVDNEKHRYYLHAHLNARLLLPLFSLKHMACHVFAHKISNCNKSFSHNALKCVWIKAHSSSLINVENFTFDILPIFAVEKKKKKKILTVAKLLNYSLHSKRLLQRKQEYGGWKYFIEKITSSSYHME